MIPARIIFAFCAVVILCMLVITCAIFASHGDIPRGWPWLQLAMLGAAAWLSLWIREQP